MKKLSMVACVTELVAFLDVILNSEKQTSGFEMSLKMAGSEVSRFPETLTFGLKPKPDLTKTQGPMVFSVIKFCPTKSNKPLRLRTGAFFTNCITQLRFESTDGVRPHPLFDESIYFYNTCLD